MRRSRKFGNRFYFRSCLRKNKEAVWRMRRIMYAPGGAYGRWVRRYYERMSRRIGIATKKALADILEGRVAGLIEYGTSPYGWIEETAEFTQTDFHNCLNRLHMKDDDKKRDDKKPAPAVKEKDVAQAITATQPNGETVKHREVGVDRKRKV